MKKEKIYSQSNNRPDEGDVAFFAQYRDLCKITPEGILFIYPESEQTYKNVPIIKKQKIDTDNVKYIGFQNTRLHDVRMSSNKTVGFFLYDSKFEHICERPWDYYNRLGQYKQVMSPDLSCFSDMSIAEQWMSVFRSRLVGAYWQYCGLTVIPTITWSNSNSFSFCFSGLEKGSVVAVSTIGTSAVKEIYMAGYREMCRVIKPEVVICYCNPYLEMRRYADVIEAEHEAHIARRKARFRPLPGQITFYDLCDNF